jgi:hypothetical protein
VAKELPRRETRLAAGLGATIDHDDAAVVHELAPDCLYLSDRSAVRRKARDRLKDFLWVEARTLGRQPVRAEQLVRHRDAVEANADLTSQVDQARPGIDVEGKARLPRVPFGSHRLDGGGNSASRRWRGTTRRRLFVTKKFRESRKFPAGGQPWTTTDNSGQMAGPTQGVGAIGHRIQEIADLVIGAAVAG